jgi:SNF2 family DNA or RNA helicase
MTTSLLEYVRHLDTVHNNSLNEESNIIIDIPDSITVSLHDHQNATLIRMKEYEQRLSNGMCINGEKFFSNCAILGDSVGVGKSLMVLAHIARLPVLEKIPNQITICSSNSSRNMFSLRSVKYSDKNEAGCLIIVPHTLFRQWSAYIKEQTNINAYIISKRAQVNDPEFSKKIMESQLVLVSNTICRHFIPRCKLYEIKWKRIFIDEADTIHIPGVYYRDFPQARFFWLITASWINLLYMNRNLYFDRSAIRSFILSEGSPYKHLHTHFLSRMTSTQASYIVETLRVRSPYLFSEMLSQTHPLRSYLVVKSSDDFIKKSISLPELITRIVLCKPPLTHRILENTISSNIQQMLHAGDIHSALKELHVKGKDVKSLIEGVTTNLTKELSNTQKTYDFKVSLEYSSPQVKEQALKSLTDKMTHLKDSIKSIEERIHNFKTEVCPICYDEPTDHLITPCCSRIFCAQCLMLSLARNSSCALCRATIHPSKCTKITTSENEIVQTAESAELFLPKKQDALLQLMKENPEGRFLVFSRFDNPFETIETAVEVLGIRVKHVKGNKDAIASTLRSFENGSLRCLLLNSKYAGAGLNITAATHVILLHAMTHEEEKQVLGRAYRIGRKGALTFIKLLHNDEEAYTEDAETEVATQT